MTALGGWENFYVIVGSSAGALIGLQFVVMTLIANRPFPHTAQGSSAFGTPTVVHFGTALGLSAALCAPWQSIGEAAVVWGLAGLGGIVYEMVVVWRMRTQTAYRPVLEDWLFHAVLPLVAYTVLAISACATAYHVSAALFCVGGAALLLLFVGVHNAWDTVTYHLFSAKQEPQETKRESGE